MSLLRIIVYVYIVRLDKRDALKPAELRIQSGIAGYRRINHVMK